MTNPYDWRGTPITPGATVIYGAGVGRSIELVEATVLPEPGSPHKAHLAANGEVWLRLVRRSYQTPSTDRVRVGPDRLTVVTELPPTTVPTAQQVIRQRAEMNITTYQARIDAARAETEPRPLRNTRGHLLMTAAEEIAYYEKEITTMRKRLTKLDQQ